MVKFTLGNIPLDEFDQGTMRLLRAVADRDGTTIKEAISEAIDWFIAHSDAERLGRPVSESVARAIEEIHPGDVVQFAPNEKHCHGAAPTNAMTHIAVQEALDGEVVDWLEKVTEEQYPRR